MNILMIRSTGGFSGAERYNLSLINGLKEKYPEIKLIFLTDNKEFQTKLEASGSVVYLVKTYINEVGTKRELFQAIIHFPWLLYVYAVAIKKIERKTKIQMICLQSTTEKIFLTPLLKILGYPVIWIEHGPLFITNRFILVKLLYKLVSSFAEQIVTVSEDTKHDLFSHGIHAQKLLSIPSAVDTDYFSPLGKREQEDMRRMLGLSKKYIIGYCGKINKEKGIKEFLYTAALICKERNDISFLLIGNGMDAKWIMTLVSQLNLQEKITHISFTDHVRRYLGIIDIFFFPTNHNEGLSMALVEAASMELLIVAHNIGGNKEIVHDGKTGFLYSISNPDTTSNLLLSILAKMSTYNDIRQNARNLAIQKYSIYTMAKAYNILFNKI